ncbi:Inner membrane protein YihN [Planctomycetes bacterium MalM25]|nr:Inner membrane protein YihN [Planctomycetes bacterium MalM25]
MQENQPSPARRVLAMAGLILAGEVIFIPAFHPGRYFRTSLLDSFGINDLQLGEAQAWYGFAAMISYALGGPLADRFGPRVLMSGSLLVTALGSLYMATLPSFLGLKLLFAFWGVSTILAFWSPLIRTTRELGGGMSQGRAFGVLDGGRGLVAWLIAAGSALAIGDQLAPGADASDGAVRSIMYGYAAVTAAVAIFVWFALPPSVVGKGIDDRGGSPREVLRLLREPAVWLMGLIVLSAYCAYKTSDYYGQYTEDIYGLTKKSSAWLTSSLTFLRILAALIAGWLADRWLGPIKTVRIGFGVLVVAFLALYAAPTSSDYLALAVANIAVAWAVGCGLRIYFAMFEESNIPASLTGSAAGIVSFVGYTPDIFWPLLAGWLLKTARDRGDVLVGYQRLWLVLACFSAVGFVAAALLRRRRPAD